MRADDVTATLTMALHASGCDSARVVQRPRLLSDNGPCYVAADLAAWLSELGMEHTRGSPSHPQTSTAGAARPSCWKGKGSNARPSDSAACSIASRQPNMTTQMGQSLY